MKRQKLSMFFILILFVCAAHADKTIRLNECSNYLMNLELKINSMLKPTEDQKFIESLEGGRYKYEGVISKDGAIGDIFKVKVKGEKQFFALKFFRFNLYDSHTGKRLSKKEINLRIKEFLQEGARGKQLKSSNLAKVYEVHRDDKAKAYYLLMKYQEGLNLRDCIEKWKIYEEFRFKIGEIFLMMDDVLKALQNGLDKGYIYTDLKPENIVVDAKNRAVLIDPGGFYPKKGSKTGFRLQSSRGYFPGKEGERIPLNEQFPIYSFGVSFGEVLRANAYLPEEENDIPKGFLGMALNDFIIRCTTPSTEDRFKTIKQVQSELKDLKQLFMQTK